MYNIIPDVCDVSLFPRILLLLVFIDPIFPFLLVHTYLNSPLELLIMHLPLKSEVLSNCTLLLCGLSAKVNAYFNLFLLHTDDQAVIEGNIH